MNSIIRNAKETIITELSRGCIDSLKANNANIRDPYKLLKKMMDLIEDCMTIGDISL